MVSPSLNFRMCSWHTVDPRSGPCGTPLTTRLHMPQMPSRQSESKTMGGSPVLMSLSLTTSSISRNDMSGETSSAVYGTIRPAPNEPPCRHTSNFRFILAMVVSSSSLSW